MTFVSEIAQSDVEELPAPSAELVLYRVTMQAFLRNMKRKDADEFLRELCETLASEDAVSQVIPLRGPGRYSDVQRARRGAVAIFRQYLPIFLSALPRK